MKRNKTTARMIEIRIEVVRAESLSTIFNFSSLKNSSAKFDSTVNFFERISRLVPTFTLVLFLNGIEEKL